MAKCIDKYTRMTSVFDYKEVELIFGIKRTPFGRGINVKKDSIVLISVPSSVDSLRHNHWDTNGDYIYCGEGSVGNQTLTGGNLAISETPTNGKTIHLIIKLSSKEYYYQGVFVLVDYTYEPGIDKNGNTRMEYKFRLRKPEFCDENVECDSRGGECCHINAPDDSNVDNDEFNPNIRYEDLYLDWKEGFQSFAIVSKHPTHITINNRECVITYSEGRTETETVRKIISKINYSRLICVLDAYYDLLSENTTPYMIQFPFGGVGGYNYTFRGKSNHNDCAFLFEGDRFDVERANAAYRAVIEDICNQ